MNVKVSYVGTIDKSARIIWPDGWPVPREGDSFDVDVLGLSEVSTVRTVVWYPHGNEEVSEPFAYVVVGPARP